MSISEAKLPTQSAPFRIFYQYFNKFSYLILGRKPKRAKSPSPTARVVAAIDAIGAIAW